MLRVLVLLQMALTAPNADDGDPHVGGRDERGSVTTEHVLWAVAVIAIVGIVVAAITTYVQAQAAKIQ